MKRRTRHVRATDLADMGFCEQKCLLKARLGERDTVASARAKRGGITEHHRFHQAVSAHHNESVRSPGASSRDRRCFIASAVYGVDHPSTEQLRSFRDRILLTSQWGRWVVATYYLISPPIARLIAIAPWLARPVGRMLDFVRRRIAPSTRKEAPSEYDDSTSQPSHDPGH